jgi:hypothetical protein
MTIPGSSLIYTGYRKLKHSGDSKQDQRFRKQIIKKHRQELKNYVKKDATLPPYEMIYTNSHHYQGKYNSEYSKKTVCLARQKMQGHIILDDVQKIDEITVYKSKHIIV